MQSSHTHMKDFSLKQFGYNQIKYKRGDKNSFPISPFTQKQVNHFDLKDI